MISAKRMLIGAISGSEAFWLASVYDSVANSSSLMNLNSIDVDSFGNVVVAGNWGPSSNVHDFAMKYSAAGVLQGDFYENPYGQGATDSNSRGVCVAGAKDGTGEVIFGVGTLANYSPSQTIGRVVTFRLSSGMAASNWVVEHSSGSSKCLYRKVFALADGSSYVIWAGSTSSSIYGIMAQKISSSGAELWSKKVTGSGNQAVAQDVDGTVVACLDASGGVLFAGTDTAFTTAGTVVITKLNADGSLAWQNRFWGSLSLTPHAMCCDNSGNIFISHGYYESDLNDWLSYITKFASDGTYQWTKTVKKNGANVASYASAMCVSPSGATIYAAYGGTTLQFNPTDGTIISAIAMGVALSDMKVFRNAIYAAGNMTAADNTKYGVIMKVPLDGSRAGTYNVGGATITYGGAAVDQWTTVTKANVSNSAGVQGVAAGYGQITPSPTPAKQAFTTTKAKVTI